MNSPCMNCRRCRRPSRCRHYRHCKAYVRWICASWERFRAWGRLGR